MRAGRQCGRGWVRVTVYAARPRRVGGDGSDRTAVGAYPEKQIARDVSERKDGAATWLASPDSVRYGRMLVAQKTGVILGHFSDKQVAEEQCMRSKQSMYYFNLAYHCCLCDEVIEYRD